MNTTEDLCEDGGGVLGGLPQTPFGNPPGYLAVIKLNGAPLAWGPPGVVNLTGLSAYAPEDPEPEFVDINDRNEAVVTLQENNHVVIVDLPTPQGQRTLWHGHGHAQRRRPHRRRRDLPDRNAGRRAARA